ncbi:MAG: hypothetical protein RMM08_09935, partial [Armatimonadota bacterium]|nr:hypothetical protein [Armatimonadota bacterium]
VYLLYLTQSCPARNGATDLAILNPVILSGAKKLSFVTLCSHSLTLSTTLKSITFSTARSGCPSEQSEASPSNNTLSPLANRSG